MTNLIRAPVVASKGHFFEVSPETLDMQAKIYDLKGNRILPNEANDDAILGIDQIAGVTLEAKIRFQISFQITRDALFSHFQQPYVLSPLFLLKREAGLSQEQVDKFFGQLILAIKAKLIGTIA